jgi:Nickel responsive protein SCO4226-like
METAPLRVAKELCVATFLVFRQLPGLTRDQYAAAQQAAGEAARQASTGGRVVRHLGGFFMPGKGWAICIFCAESLAEVTAVNERAGVPFTEILEAIELRPRDKA